MLNVRMIFEKTGPAKYMSHLDLVRCFGRSMRRAGIPFYYTEGFNPHPALTFGQPLSLGTAGLRESADIKLTEDMSFDELIERLNTSLPEGLKIISAAQPVHKCAEITYAAYEIDIEGTDCAKELESFLSQDEIKAKKKNKKKQIVEMNLKPAVREYRTEAHEGGTRLEITLAAGNESNVNPSLLLEAFFGQSGINAENVGITRKELLCTKDAVSFI